MNNNKNFRTHIFFSLSLVVLLNTSFGISSLAMEGQKEIAPGAEKKPKQSLVSQFSTINEEDLDQTVFQEALKKKLYETINKERYLGCYLTRSHTIEVVGLLNKNASYNEIHGFLKECKKRTAPDFSETILNIRPKDMKFMPYLDIEQLFESVGVKWQKYWYVDEGEIMLQAYNNGVPLKIDPKTQKYVPFVLTPAELDLYQTYHDFRVTINNFLKDYTKLINTQRIGQGKAPMEDLEPVEDFTDHPPVKPMSFEEKQEMIHKARKELGEKLGPLYQESEQSNVSNLQENKEAEQKRVSEEKANVQAGLKRLITQEQQNEEKIRISLVEKLKNRQKAKEEEERNRHEQPLQQLLKDEELARKLDKELNGDEELARSLDRQFNN